MFLLLLIRLNLFTHSDSSYLTALCKKILFNIHFPQDIKYRGMYLKKYNATCIGSMNILHKLT